MASILGMPPVDQAGFDLLADQSAHIITTSIALIALATSFVLLRLTSRWLARAGYWWDDIMIVIALLLAIVPPIMGIWGAKFGGLGQHIWVLKPTPIVVLPTSFKMLYIFQIFFCLSTATIKLCTLAFYNRIFPAPSVRMPLFTLAAVIIMFLIASTSITIFQCSPIHKFWDVDQPGTCLEVLNLLYVLGSINTALDFLVVLLPVPLLWQLRTSIRQKCLLTGIFLMAGFVCVVSMIRLILWSHTNPSDVTWNSVPVNLWSATEPVAGIICACVPSLRPLLSRLYHALTTATSVIRCSSPSSSSKSALQRKASVFSVDSFVSRKLPPPRPLSEDLEEMGKIARGHSPWGCDARAYGGWEDGDLEMGKAGWEVRGVEVPRGKIAVKTDLRISICTNNWEYMDRVF